MPNVWMHLEYGRELERGLPSGSGLATEIAAAAPVFRMGCQGPDLLYYCGFWPWSRKTDAGRLGDLLHGSRCGPFLMELWCRTLALPAPERAPAAAYFAGFLTHHVLDRVFHPYINWKAGYRYRDHQRFEIMLDILFVRRLRGIDVWKRPAWKALDAGPRLPEPVTRILQAAVHTVYPEERLSFSGNDWDRAYRDMVNALRLLFDPTGLKRRLAGASSVAALFYRKPGLVEERLDYLNERNQLWRHSADYGEMRYDSALEMWDQALAEGGAVLRQLADWIGALGTGREASARETFRRLLGNRSYDTGKACDGRYENRYAEPIWGLPAGG